jgi:hypothetical protein
LLGAEPKPDSDPFVSRNVVALARRNRRFGAALELDQELVGPLD